MDRLRLPKNEAGRDFVCGDVHGAFERIEQFFEHVKFDPSKDRLISVGDLVDRGPENIECLNLLYEPWFHCVRGNHEVMMNDYLTDSPYGIFWPNNGGVWGMQYKTEQSDIAMQVRDMARIAAERPLMLTVERQDGKLFHVIHAELSATGPITDEDLENDEKFKDVAFSQTMDGDFIIWGRFIFYNLYKQQLNEHNIAKFKRGAALHKMGAMFNDKLSHIYCGHTIVQQPVRYKGQTNLDTGAYASIWKDATPYGSVPDVPDWCGLTFTEPLTDRFWHVSARGVTETKPVVLE